MGLLDFNKPKWRHKNPAVRLAAIDTIDPQETEILAALSRDDQDREVRRAAISKLTDLTVLGQLEDKADPGDLPFISARKDSLLYDLVVNSRDIETSRANLEQITSPDLLANLAVNGREPAVRLAAVGNIEDQLLLAEIVKQNCGKEPATAAMAKINTEELLLDLTRNAASKTARRLAADKIAALEELRNQPDQDEILAHTLDELATEAAQLRANAYIDDAAARLSAIKLEWQKLDSEYKHPAYELFSEICSDFEKRFAEIQERRKIEQEKGARYEQQQARLDEICGTIEKLTGSIAQEAEAAKEQAEADWAALLNDPNGKVVPSATMAKRFANACQTFDSNQQKIRREKGLVDDMEKKCAESRKLIAAHDLKKAAVRLAEAEKDLAIIKFKYFPRTAMQKLVTETAAELTQTETNLRRQNLAKRLEICGELETLASADNHSGTERQLQALRQSWLQLPNLEDETGIELNQRYQKAADDLTEKLQTFQNEQEWQLWANLSLKEKLTDTVEALDQQENLETVVNKIKEAQIAWKTIGPVPHKKAQQLWDKFHSACNRNFDRAEPYLEELKNRRAEAMVRRQEICLLATELAESTEWQKTATALKGLQEEWQSLMHGSRRKENELYQQFREACNRFFARRHEDFQSKKEERGQHLRDKEKLCEEAERLAAEPQADQSQKFQNLQAAWKKIGPVARKQEEAIWKRFRGACDQYFNWRGEEQQQNLKRKEELCAEVERLLAETTEDDNQKEIAAKLTEIQQQWKEIGPVPHDQSEAVWQRFRKPCDIFFTARQQQFAKEEEQRLLNQGQKEELLARAEKLASQGTDKKTTAQLQKLQKEWYEAGPAPREINKELNDRFKTLCDAFFEGRRQYFADLTSEQLENQKKKESLCLRLENLTDTTYQPIGKSRSKALSLAEELKQAMEDNFMLAGRRNEKKTVQEEIKRIEQDWQKIGPVPHEQTRPLTARYQKALDSYYKSQRKEASSVPGKQISCG